MEKLSKVSKHQFPERATLLGDDLSITRNVGQGNVCQGCCELILTLGSGGGTR